jgi:hypothetical protein
VTDDTAPRRPEPHKWWVLGVLVVALGLAAAVQARREAGRPEPAPPLHPRYRVGQRWRVAARPHEPHATVTVLAVERSERDGVLVHVQVDGVRLETPEGVLERIRHLPLTAAALDASVEDLEALASPYDDYVSALARWRAGYVEGRWPAITTHVRDGIAMTELSLNR